jgi:hypothetical protein
LGLYVCIAIHPYRCAVADAADDDDDLMKDEREIRKRRHQSDRH